MRTKDYGGRPNIEDPRELLYVCTDELYCGCGNPEEALALLHELLKAAPFYQSHERLAELLPTPGIEMLVLGALDKAELIEHGSSIGGSWLTDRGMAVLVALHDVAAAEGYRDFVNSDRCCHGRVGGCPRCPSSWEPLSVREARRKVYEWEIKEYA